jgi:hypothetical protein
MIPSSKLLGDNCQTVKLANITIVVEKITPQTLFRAPLAPGVGVQGWNLAKNLSAIKIYYYAKFHQDQSDG